MKEIDYNNFLTELVKPLVMHPNDVSATTLAEDGDLITIQIMVHADDLGRVIGKKGRVANAIRTIAYSSAARNNKKIEILIDSF